MEEMTHLARRVSHSDPHDHRPGARRSNNEDKLALALIMSSTESPAVGYGSSTVDKAIDILGSVAAFPDGTTCRLPAML